MNEMDMTICDVSFKVTEDDSDWRAGFAAWLNDSSRSFNTIAGYMQDVRVFSNWFEKHTGEVFSPDLLNSFDLRSFREHSLGVERVAAATWNRRRASLTALCSWAGHVQLMDSILPQAEVEAPPRALDRSDFGRLMRTVERRIYAANTEKRRLLAIRDGAMVALLLMAGLRVGEVCALHCEDLYVSHRKGRVIIRRGKGDKQRPVPLSAPARQLILPWLEVRKCGRFLDITEREAQKRIAELKTAAGIETDLTPHVLRHTFCTRLSRSGAPIGIQKKVMGHVKTETTLRYNRPSWEDLELAVEAGCLGISG